MTTEALDPKKAIERAPDTFTVLFNATKGSFKVRLTRSYSPNGVDRFYNLVKMGYFKDIAIFRVIENFIAQFGIHGDPAVSKVWREASIKDDPASKSNKAGTLTFATAGKDTRTTQLFINLKDNVFLDSQGFTPIGEVIDGMSVVKEFYSSYGEGAPQGKGPAQMSIQSEGNAYLKKNFSKLDYINSVVLQ